MDRVVNNFVFERTTTIIDTQPTLIANPGRLGAISAVDRLADDRYRPGSTSFSCEVPPALFRLFSSTFLSRSLAHLRSVYNPGRVRARTCCTTGESERERDEERLTRGTKGREGGKGRRELLAGYSTPLPTVFLDYYRRSCAHNLCFPSTVRKRAVRQRRAHNDAIV
ncbi:hypothetical protein PUN28_013754 [Cardiocondyla obscurior]|uniref:Uncharacterized protein n=1 Tax=Cardiocondyla obscurior TaxID=286306 RepID=A0AAW2F804_9HYME